MKTTLRSIAVFCGSSAGNDPKIIENAHALGKRFAKENIQLIYGGSKLGLMGEVARGVLENGGEAVGIIPDFLKTKEIAHEHLTELVVVNNMHERKLKMQQFSDAMITLPGGFGTMEEFFEILTWAQLGLHQKPTGLLNVAGFYDELLQAFEKMTATGLLKKSNLELLCVADNIEGLLQKMNNFQPRPVPKWLHENQT